MNFNPIFASESVNDIGMDVEVNANAPWDKVRSAYERGDFKPYEHLLVKKQSSWDRYSKLDVLKEIVERKSYDETKHKNDWKLIYLFKLAIDPLAEAHEISNNINSYINQLDEKEKESLLYDLKNMEAGLSILILKHCKSDLIEAVCKQAIRSKWYMPENFFPRLFLGLIDMNLALNEKKAFLDDFFNALLLKTSEDVIYEFLNSSSEKQQENFINVCSDTLAKRICDLKAEIPKLCAEKILELKGKPSVVRTGFSDHKQKFFLNYFFNELRNGEYADLFAASFSDDDWSYLSSKLGFSISLAMNWMIRISERLNDPSFCQTMKENHFDCSIWCFYRKVSKLIAEKSGVSVAMYERLAKAQNPLVLDRFFGSFDARCKKVIAEHLVKNEPEKFVLWLESLLNSSKKDENLNELFSSLSSLDLLADAAKVFCRAIGSRNQIAIYCALDNRHRMNMLKLFFANEKAALELLSDWISIVISENLTQDSFARDFYANLKKINPGYPKALKDILKPSLLETDLLFIDELLPLDMESLSSAERQLRALEKLKSNFLKTNCSHKEREKFISSIREDLRASHDGDPELVNKLFQNLPPITWPLIFLHFGHLIMTYYDNQPPVKNGLRDDPVKLVDICAVTLSQMIDNPHLTSEDDRHESCLGWAMQNLYQVVCETNTIYLVIQKFMEITPKDKFFPTMYEFASSAFYYNKDGFKGLIAECLNKAKIDKTDFIVECIIAEKNKGNRSRYSSLTRQIWEAPFLEYDGDRASVAKKLIAKLGVQYLSSFLDGSIPNDIIFPALKNADEHYCLTLFYEIVGVLTQVNNEPDFKLVLLQKVCECYAYAKYDVMMLLSCDDAQSFLPEVEKWYHHYPVEAYENLIGNNLLNFQLLRFFNEEAFYPTVVSKIKAILSDERHVSFYELSGLVKNLFKMQCAEDFMDFNQELSELLQKQFELNPVDYFEQESSKLNALLFRWVPDWQARLITWTLAEIKKGDKPGRTYFVQKDYPNVDKIYESLAKLGVLDSWLMELANAAPDEAKDTLDRIYTQYSKDLKQT